ncbi:hypothetical protein DSCA_00030 [Desulfosarcina alkanivorans]|jgi:hypothetical protein|uniref:Uncharacterized protein n=1 Tax=Desulfosarcina alkanivorans TaxID=571177 RepID=A0A5K7YBW3_9BACT|nr:hypothetical protein [Desulfosarcina alkanivorans]BBO66073.1 hypothetical protein DSCA_00030 [Desulfosarcina alkanivorans]
MTSEQEMKFSLDHYVGCFGRYRKNDPICRFRCALNLRCAIEHDQNERFEILEELVSSSGMVIKVN